ncbi:MAG TPA: hypothetical protein VF372_08050, partial [Thermodesulfobacteriota bacterium]
MKKNEEQGILRLKTFLKRINMPGPIIRCCLWDSALLQKKEEEEERKMKKLGYFSVFALVMVLFL